MFTQLPSQSNKWSSTQRSEAKSYLCGYCGKWTEPNEHYFAQNRHGVIYICGACRRPTYFPWQSSIQIPAPLLGQKLDHLPQDVEAIYEEARACTSVGAYTAAAMCCRKILMNVAVDRGAKVGLKFVQYVKYLADNNIIGVDSHDWVDSIRTAGNEANHEIVIIGPKQARDIMRFTEMLLKMVYEYPGLRLQESGNAAG